MHTFDKKFQDWVRYTTGQLMDYFNLDEWGLQLYWVKEQRKESCTASINVDVSYLSAGISIYPYLEQIYQEDGQRQALHTLVHEFCHILTAPLHDVAAEGSAQAAQGMLHRIYEQQTERITNIILKNLPSKVYTQPKKTPRTKPKKKAA
jgi:hypothetical protein